MSKQEGEAGRLVDYAVVQEPRLGRMERPELVGLAQRVIEESGPAAPAADPAALTVTEAPMVVGSLLDDDEGWWDESEPIQVYRPPEPDVPTVAASFTVPEARWKELEGLLAKALAKAAKQGVKMNVSTQPGLPFYHKDDVDEVDPIATRIVTLIEPAQPVVKGWELLAVVEHGRDDDGNPVNVILRDPSSPYKVPKKFRNEESYCDHCKTRRRRNQTWLLVKTDPDFVGQPIHIERVGSKCLKDYTEVVDVKALLERYDVLTEIRETLRGASGWVDEARGFGERVGPAYADYLSFVAAQIAKAGWEPKWIGRERNPRPATAQEAWAWMTQEWPHQPAEVARFRDEALEAIAWARAIPSDVDNDYLSNLRGSVYLGGVQPKVIGILASLIPAYRRSKEGPQTTQPHSYFLKVGDKFNATFGKKSSTAQAGPRSAVVTFTSDKGYSGMTELYAEPGDGYDGAYFFIWENLAKKNMPVGTRVTVSGKVKQHSEYQGKKRTVLYYTQVDPA